MTDIGHKLGFQAICRFRIVFRLNKFGTGAALSFGDVVKSAYNQIDFLHALTRIEFVGEHA